MMLVDAEASHYIATRWTERQREFGRLYWMYLTRKRPRPPYTFCFGAERIATKLEGIWRDYSRPEFEE